MKFLRRLFKRNWQVLAAIGFDYLRKNLLDRIQFSNNYFGSLFQKVIELGDESIGRLTDDEPNDKEQLKQLMDENIEELIVLVNAGAVTEIKKDETRVRVIAILQDTCAELKSQVTDRSLLPSG